MLVLARTNQSIEVLGISWKVFADNASPKSGHIGFIDICINNAIQFPSGGNTYAPTEGKCRFARGPSPAGAGPVGHGPVLHRLKWSPQKPETRAVERDQEAIERWKRKDWPRVKKTLGGWAPT